METGNVPEYWQFLGTMGVGGILGGFAIWMLNKAWKEHAETIKGFHDNERGRTEMLMDVVTKNTIQTTTNTEVLKSLHRRLDKDAQERL